MFQETIDTPPTRELETALFSLAKLAKAFNFYPPGHPSLADVTEQTWEDFQPLLSRREIHPSHVTCDGFSHKQIPLATQNPILKDFARKLVERRVRHLLFLPELEKQELATFAREVSKPAQELWYGASLSERLSQQEIKTVWINETGLDAVLEQYRQDPGNEIVASIEQILDHGQREELSLPDKAAADRVRELLERLKEPLDDHTYLGLQQKVKIHGGEFLRRTGLPGGLTLFSLLLVHQRDDLRSGKQRRAAESAVDKLLTPEIRQMLVTSVADRNLKVSQQRLLARLLTGLELKIAPQLLACLATESDTTTRRQYADILANMGEALFPLLRKALDDPKWYLVRNAVYILGETRLKAALPLLNRALPHPDLRVRRALVRALGTIGSTSAAPLLLKLSYDGSEDLSRAAIQALGGLGASEVVPSLLKQLNEFDLLGKRTERKIDIIRTLGMIKSPRAINSLLRFASQPPLPRPKHIDMLRTEAINTINRLGYNHLLPPRVQQQTDQPFQRVDIAAQTSPDRPRDEKHAS